MSEPVDLGDGHTMSYFSWAPDDLPANREHFGYPLPNVPKAGVTVAHPHKTKPGEECLAAVHFDLPEVRRYAAGPLWTVVTWEPLTLSPSLLCLTCGDHGFIRDGRWVAA